MTLAERLWSKIEIERRDECWRWTGMLSVYGYGLIKIANKSRLAHRVIWELTHGPLEPGECVLHHCDNRWCVNVEHCLFVGTKGDNNRDRSAKGRSCPRERQWTHLRPEDRLFGEKNGRAKLTPEIAEQIRHRYAVEKISQQALADEYGVAQPQISKVILRRRWV